MKSDALYSMRRSLLLLGAALSAATIVTAQPFTVPATDACPNPIQTTGFLDNDGNVGYGVACECTIDTCGTYPTPWVPPSSDEALVITTSQEAGFLSHATAPVEKTTTTSSAATDMAITVNPTVAYQEIFGFGAATTDAVAYVLTEVLDDPALMEEVLTQAFDHVGMTFTRVPMNSADFSRMNYALSYNLDASDFCLRDDRTPDGENVTCGEDYKLDVLEKITDIQADLKVIISSWSAAPSFKTQNFTCDSYTPGVIECHANVTAPAQSECVRTVADPNTCVGQPIGQACPASPANNYSEGFPLYFAVGDSSYNPENIPSKNANGNCYNQGFVKEEAYMGWATVYAKFIEAMESRSISVWGVTSQNEFLTQTGLWGSNFWTVSELSRFVNDFMSPIIRRVKPDINLMVYDDQFINLTNGAMDLMDNTLNHSQGIAYHWYTSLESTFENSAVESFLPIAPPIGGGLGVKELYDRYNGTKFLIQSEMCSGYLLGSNLVGPAHGSFGYGYNLAHDMMWQFRNRASAYLYWNLILDEQGGPNLAGNYVDSPMYVANSTTFVQNPSFFYLAHYSRAVPPGSLAVEANVVCNAKQPEYCQFVAFRTPDENLVVVLTNDEVTMTNIPAFIRPPLAQGQGEALDWSISCGSGDDSSTVTGTLPWQSIQTVIMPCPGAGQPPTVEPMPSMPSPTPAPSSAPTSSSSSLLLRGGRAVLGQLSLVVAVYLTGAFA